MSLVAFWRWRCGLFLSSPLSSCSCHFSTQTFSVFLFIFLSHVVFFLGQGPGGLWTGNRANFGGTFAAGDSGKFVAKDTTMTDSTVSAHFMRGCLVSSRGHFSSSLFRPSAHCVPSVPWYCRVLPFHFLFVMAELRFRSVWILVVLQPSFSDQCDSLFQHIHQNRIRFSIPFFSLLPFLPLPFALPHTLLFPLSLSLSLCHSEDITCPWHKLPSALLQPGLSSPIPPAWMSVPPLLSG